MTEAAAYPLVSIVVPVFNERECVEKLYERLQQTLAQVEADYEFIFIDDGSSDGTVEILRTLAEADKRVRVLVLSRNFGHQAALSAGLNMARGHAVVMMDADLQHPPELVRELIGRWREGYEVVYTVRREAEKSGWFKRVTSKLFYQLFNRLSGLNLEFGVADFRLLDRRAVTVLKRMPERGRFVRGLVKWIGFRQCAVPYQAAARFAGQTKYSVAKMVVLAVQSIISFSVVPLRLAAFLGVIIGLISFLGLVYVVVVRLFSEQWVLGWASILFVVLFIGGVQLIFIGLIGEYIGQIYNEVKQRPLYIIREQIPEPGPEDSEEGNEGT